MIKRYFPPVRETMLVVVITVVFLLLTATCIGLRPEHFLMAGLFFVLFFFFFFIAGCGFFDIL